MFNRQWFSGDSQAGLQTDSITFERSLRIKDFRQCIRILNTIDIPYSNYWLRQKERMLHVLNRYSTARTDIRVYFDGFWPDMNPFNCQMLDLLMESLNPINIVVTLDPADCDISFYSCYGNLSSLAYTRHSHRIIFLGENIRPSYQDFDLAITFDQANHRCRNIYFPIWLLEIDWFSKQYVDRKTNPLSVYTNNVELNCEGRQLKIVYIGNNHEPFRMSLIYDLAEYGIPIDCYGSQTRPVNDKASLLRNYYISIAMENSIYPTYQTEKLLQAYPYVPHIFYWGAKLPSVFTENNYIHAIDQSINTKNIAQCIKQVLVNKTIVANKPPLLDNEETRKIFKTAMYRIKQSLSYLI